ncbi:MAG: leucine--tRNA ligase [Chlamydiae bacterium]|nr:leucine--tRNA ligase [Chlamydiota bacterium]
MAYDHHSIEKKWQAFWEKNKTFKTDIFSVKPKYYLLDMFPYPSGSGLHVGHASGYTATDIVSRFKRLKGHEVLHPMGWDSFGLPAEQYAIRTGIHPAQTTEENINTYRTQIKGLGLSYDWDREIKTSEPDYYRWTQWIFKRLYDRGLAYEANILVNYCPGLRTVLANEEVENGFSKEGGYPVERRPLRQWVLKITAYAERLLEDLDELDWPDSLKALQRNWIGKSHGVELLFTTAQDHVPLSVFTTRIDTIFGVTFLVISPEHAMLDRIVSIGQHEAVNKYKEEVSRKSDLERTDLNKDKTGVFTGSMAVHPITKALIPIYVADYVIMGYGTGCVMGVPAHDERDKEFQEKFGLASLKVIDDSDGKEVLVHSHFNDVDVNGKTPDEAKEFLQSYFTEKQLGKVTTQYKLRDWLFSRQRYWGEPIPILHFEDGTKRSLDDDELPLLPPHIDNYLPSEDGQSPLTRVESWVQIIDPKTQKKAMRETNTMPQWAGSCWYYLRFLDPHNKKAPWDPMIENHWMPVDLYVGGVEHAVLHLLYARFWHKVLFDLGLVSTKEPFKKLKNQGLITAFAYKIPGGGFVAPSDVEERNGEYFDKRNGQLLKKQLEKMSKSKLNGVNPLDVVSQYGADTLRLYVTFMGPFDREKIWSDEAIVGCHRFLIKVMDLFEKGKIVDEYPLEIRRLTHKLIYGVEKDIEELALNTAISKMMEFVNAMQKHKNLPKEAMAHFLIILSPFAPHIAEELFERLGYTKGISFEMYPTYDPMLLVDATCEIAVQVNGKVRASMVIEKGTIKDDVLQKAMEIPQIQKYVDKAIERIIFVPDKILNICVKD